MPRKRNAENVGLPKRWQHKHSAFYYQVPPGLEKQWDGKKLFRLGSSLPEAHRTWASRIEFIDSARTVAELIDRYSMEYLPTLAPKTKESYLPALARIKVVFGDMDCIDVKSHMAVTYFDRVRRERGHATARNDIGVLRGLFTMALRWGTITSNPLTGLRFEQLKAATDEVHQWQIDIMLSLKPTTRNITLVQLYIRLKLATGLRRGDLLTLTLDNIKVDGIHVTLRKTEKTTGKRLVFLFIDPATGQPYGEFKQLIDDILTLKPRKSSGFLFTTQSGHGFMNELTGRANGFDTAWRRFNDVLIEKTEIDTRIKEKTLRSFVADESTSLGDAANRLGHSNTATTSKHYRRKADVVTPLPLRPENSKSKPTNDD